MATQDDQLLTPPRRRRPGTWGKHPHIQESDITGDIQTGEGLVMVNKRHLEGLEAKLSRVEGVLQEILVTLEKKNRVTRKSQSANNLLFDRTSCV